MLQGIPPTPQHTHTHFGKGLSLGVRSKQVCVTLTPIRWNSPVGPATTLLALSAQKLTTQVSTFRKEGTAPGLHSITAVMVLGWDSMRDPDVTWRQTVSGDTC